MYFPIENADLPYFSGPIQFSKGAHERLRRVKVGSQAGDRGLAAPHQEPRQRLAGLRGSKLHSGGCHASDGLLPLAAAQMRVDGDGAQHGHLHGRAHGK